MASSSSEKCFFCGYAVFAVSYLVCQKHLYQEARVQLMRETMSTMAQALANPTKTDPETLNQPFTWRRDNLPFGKIINPNFDPLYGMGDAPIRSTPWTTLPSVSREDSDDENNPEIAIPYKHRSKPKPATISIRDELIQYYSSSSSSDDQESIEGNEEAKLQTLFKREQQRRFKRRDEPMEEDSEDEIAIPYKHRSVRTKPKPSWNEIRAQLTQPLPCPIPRELRCTKPMRGDPFWLPHEYAFYEITIVDCTNNEVITTKYLTLKNLNEKVNQNQIIIMKINDHEWHWFQGEELTYSWIVEDSEDEILRRKSESSQSNSSSPSQIIELSSEPSGSSGSSSSSGTSAELLQVSGCYPLDALEHNFNFIHPNGQDWREEENANEVGNVEINFNIIESSSETSEEEYHDANAGNIVELLQDAMRREEALKMEVNSVADWIRALPCPPGCDIGIHQ